MAFAFKQSVKKKFFPSSLGFQITNFFPSRDLSSVELAAMYSEAAEML